MYHGDATRKIRKGNTTLYCFIAKPNEAENTHQWPMVFLFNILDCVGVCACVRWNCKHPERKTKKSH
ncbi:hypothetical protein T06_4144 [Trichinella sp. T6]|nr:hypothetical protein T06_4144 [Trichinella sp. T6]